MLGRAKSFIVTLLKGKQRNKQPFIKVQIPGIIYNKLTT